MRRTSRQPTHTSTRRSRDTTQWRGWDRGRSSHSSTCCSARSCSTGTHFISIFDSCLSFFASLRSCFLFSVKVLVFCSCVVCSHHVPESIVLVFLLPVLCIESSFCLCSLCTEFWLPVLSLSLVITPCSLSPLVLVACYLSAPSSCCLFSLYP